MTTPNSAVWVGGLGGTKFVLLRRLCFWLDGMKSMYAVGFCWLLLGGTYGGAYSRTYSGTDGGIYCGAYSRTYARWHN